MMRRSAAWHTLCFLVGGLTLLTSGCTDNQIGRLCNNPGQPVKNGVTFVNPAPDCPTRLCMITPPSTSANAKLFRTESRLSSNLSNQTTIFAREQRHNKVNVKQNELGQHRCQFTPLVQKAKTSRIK